MGDFADYNSAYDSRMIVQIDTTQVEKNVAQQAKQEQKLAKAQPSIFSKKEGDEKRALLHKVSHQNDNPFAVAKGDYPELGVNLNKQEYIGPTELQAHYAADSVTDGTFKAKEPTNVFNTSAQAVSDGKEVKHVKEEVSGMDQQAKPKENHKPMETYLFSWHRKSENKQNPHPMAVKTETSNTQNLSASAQPVDAKQKWFGEEPSMTFEEPDTLQVQDAGSAMPKLVRENAPSEDSEFTANGKGINSAPNTPSVSDANSTPNQVKKGFKTVTTQTQRNAALGQRPDAKNYDNPISKFMANGQKSEPVKGNQPNRPYIAPSFSDRPEVDLNTSWNTGNFNPNHQLPTKHESVERQRPKDRPLSTNFSDKARAGNASH